METELALASSWTFGGLVVKASAAARPQFCPKEVIEDIANTDENTATQEPGPKGNGVSAFQLREGRSVDAHSTGHPKEQ